MFGICNAQNTILQPWNELPFTNRHFPAGKAGSKTSISINSGKEVSQTLTDELLEFCKCNYCNCYVTVGPVRMVDNKIACGRCKLDDDGIRLMIVEALAKQFGFPCRYKSFGCNAILKWVLIDSHEKVCGFKEIHCTVIDCDWIGAKSSLKLHFEQNHADEIIHSQKGIVMNLQEKKTCNFLYLSKNNTFMVLLSNDGENIFHQVKFFCTSLEACMYIYDVYVYDSEKKLMFLNQKLQCFDDDICMYNTGLSVNVLKSVFSNTSNVTLSFQIKYTTCETTSFSAQNIECPVCFEPMVGNIMVGVCGHSVCEQCKKSLQNCPCCRFHNTFGNKSAKQNHDIRNYFLENLIKKLNLDL